MTRGDATPPRHDPPQHDLHVKRNDTRGTRRARHPGYLSPFRALFACRADRIEVGPEQSRLRTKQSHQHRSDGVERWELRTALRGGSGTAIVASQHGSPPWPPRDSLEQNFRFCKEKFQNLALHLAWRRRGKSSMLLVTSSKRSCSEIIFRAITDYEIPLPSGSSTEARVEHLQTGASITDPDGGEGALFEVATESCFPNARRLILYDMILSFLSCPSPSCQISGIAILETSSAVEAGVLCRNAAQGTYSSFGKRSSNFQCSPLPSGRNASGTSCTDWLSTTTTA